MFVSWDYTSVLQSSFCNINQVLGGAIIWSLSDSPTPNNKAATVKPCAPILSRIIFCETSDRLEYRAQ